MATPAFVVEQSISSNKTAGTTLDHFLGPNATAGNLIVARIIFDNAAVASKPVVSSISKMPGEPNNWVFLGAARSTSTSAGAFASGEMWCIRTSIVWTGGPTYVITFDTSVTMKAATFTEYSGVDAVQRCTMGSAYSTTTTAASATTTGTTPQVGDLVLGLVFGSNVAAVQAGDTDTTAGAWSTPRGFGSTGSSAASNNFGYSTHKFLTAATHQTLNNSAAMTAGNGAVVAILVPATDPVITQAAYRFYREGPEAGNVALVAQDTAPTIDVLADRNIQLRVRMQLSAAAATYPSDDWQLQCEKNSSGTWFNVVPSVFGSDYVTGESGVQLSNTTPGAGQAFMGNGQPLLSAKFRVSRTGNPPTDIACRLYTALGNFGVSNRPTGTFLTKSAVKTAASIPLSGGWVEFTFDGSFTLTNGVAYCLLVREETPTATDRFNLSVMTTGPHPGNYCYESPAGSYTYQSLWDACHQIFTAEGGQALAIDAQALTHGAATTNQLTGGSGTFVAGEVSEDGQATDFGWSAGNFTELLYSIKLRSTLAVSDTLRFRVLYKGATTYMTYAVTPTLTVTKAAVVPTDGLQAWLDADDASTFAYKSGVSVSQWRDKGPGVHHFAGPGIGNAYRNGAINGRTTVVVTGDLDSCAYTSAPLITDVGNFAMFVVCRRTGGNATNSIPLFAGFGGSNGIGIAVRAGASNGYGFLVGGIAWNQSLTPDDGGVHVHTLTRSGVYGHYVDGIATSNSGQVLQTPNAPNNDTLTPSNVAGHAFAGDICEVLIYNRPVSTEERLLIENYLKVRWIPPGGKIKVWNGSAWVEKPVKAWNGSAWVEKPVKVWNGSAWVLS